MKIWHYSINTTDGYGAKSTIVGRIPANTSREAVTKIANWLIYDFSDDDDAYEIDLQIKCVN